jgi:hypothetical protein
MKFNKLAEQKPFHCGPERCNGTSGYLHRGRILSKRDLAHFNWKADLYCGLTTVCYSSLDHIRKCKSRIKDEVLKALSMHLEFWDNKNKPDFKSNWHKSVLYDGCYLLVKIKNMPIIDAKILKWSSIEDSEKIKTAKTHKLDKDGFIGESFEWMVDDTEGTMIALCSFSLFSTTNMRNI